MDWLTFILLISSFYILFSAFETRWIRLINNKVDTSILEITDSLNDIKNKIENIENNNQYTDEEKQELHFEDSQNLNLEFFEKLKKGTVLRFISGSYYHPSDNLILTKFKYKHDHVDKTKKGQFGWEVHGFEKTSPEDKWAPCFFFANEKDCSTSSCSGTIKLNNYGNI